MGRCSEAGTETGTETVIQVEDRIGIDRADNWTAGFEMDIPDEGTRKRRDIL